MNEADFAYRIRQALDEGADALDYPVRMRLQKARRAALDRIAPRQTAPAESTWVWVPALQGDGTAGATGGPESRASTWAWHAGWILPIVALALGILGIQQWQNERMIARTADIDLSLLLDDTPIATLAHQGFGEYLRRNLQTPIPEIAPQVPATPTATPTANAAPAAPPNPPAGP